MNRVPVLSSNLKSVGYNEATGILEIEFRRDGVYQYFPAPTMNVSISRARSKLILIGNPITFTARSNDEEEGAKRYYRTLFEMIEELAGRSLSLIINSVEI